MSERPDDPTLSAIAAREQAATAGPWTHQDFGTRTKLDDDPLRVAEIRSEVAGGVLFHAAFWPLHEADADFIAHARTDIPWLLAEISRLSAAVDTERERALRWASENPRHEYANGECVRADGAPKETEDEYAERGLAALRGGGEG